MTIALVIGHKPTSKGAYNKSTNLHEYEYNDSLVGYISHKLPKNIEHIIVHRETYKGLPDKINSLNPELILSFHCNAFNTEVSGSETLYYHKSKKGKAYAQEIQKRIVDVLGLPDRGIKGKSAEDRGGHLLKYTNAPCLILEPFFIDNDDDLEVALLKQNDLIDMYVKFIYDVVNDKIEV